MNHPDHPSDPSSAREPESRPAEEPVAKPDLFDYLESQPDVEDPFPPSEPDPEPEPQSDAELLARRFYPHTLRTGPAHGKESPA